MKKYNEFINEDKKFQYIDYLEIKDYVTKVLIEKLNVIEVGNEGTTVITANSNANIPGIGSQTDFELKDGSYSRVIVGVRLFYGNSDFIGAFDSMSDLGKHIVKVEDIIKSTFAIETISNSGEYFFYLIPITEEIRNLSKANQTVDKFDL